MGLGIMYILLLSYHTLFELIDKLAQEAKLCSSNPISDPRNLVSKCPANHFSYSSSDMIF